MATKISLKNPNPGTWFKLDPDDPESAEICIRTCGIDDIKEIRKKTVKKVRILKNGQVYWDEQVDEDLQNELTWDICIEDWRGLIDDEGNEIPCTKEMKKFLMGKSIKFARRVTECIAQLNEIEREEVEIEEKN